MEGLSALMDGELEPEEAGRQLSRLKQDAALQEIWDAYHVVGDAMRGAAPLAAGFSTRFSERLAAEPTVLAPQRRAARRIPTGLSYALSAAASLSAVAAVAWVALSGGMPATPEQQARLAPASAAAPAVATAAAPVEALAHDYLLAHQGVSPSTALQGVAPYVRTVTMTQQMDGR